MTKTLSGRSLSLALALGVFGGATLVIAYMTLSRGPMTMLYYAVMVLVMTLVIRAEGLMRFTERFTVGLIAFMTASLIFYVAVGLNAQGMRFTEFSAPALWGHTWRIAFMLALGVVINLPAARLASPPMHANAA